MKKTDLEKNKGMKLEGRLRHGTPTDRFGQQSNAIPDRRAKRKLDSERGLVPFAVKINGELVQQVRALAESRGIELSELVEDVLRKGLEAQS